MATQKTLELGDDKSQIATRAAGNEKFLGKVLEVLNGENRTQRVQAARAVHELAVHSPDTLRSHGQALADALEKPEAQTRWETLGALEKMVACDARVVDKAIGPATTALHDEESGVVRLAAFRLLSAYGATTAKRSEKVWPLIDEAIRVYHGDPEFPAMLTGVYRLVMGAASDKVKIAAAERMDFDAENAKGLLGRRAKRIVGCAPRRRRKTT
ncbi:MAG: hypothetical protein Q8K99_01865 [Actinomycetota bacterium]|nr:hypothetical protein [Actinomycetota bacterium]